MMEPVDGLGATDCSCQSHLFFNEVSFDLDRLFEAIDGRLRQY